MQRLTVLLVAIAVHASAFNSKKAADHKHPIRQEIVDDIKLKATSWTPKEVGDNHMRHYSQESIKSSMGHLGTSPASLGVDMLKSVAGSAMDVFHKFTSAAGLSSKDKESTFHLKATGDAYDESSEFPESFSWRTKMPECIGPIEDQGECGSCWAFTSAGLLSDRFCIHTDGAITTRLSPQELVNCNYENYGCMGGYLITSIDYLMVEGAVSNQCVPYEETAYECTFRCTDGGETAYDKYYCKPGTIAIAVTQEEIKKELIENGPLLMGLQIFEDFMNYEQGIYKYTTGENIGGHAMKLVGYGYDQQEGLYWEMQNQWTTDWGEEGFVKIKHGEIGIDSIGIACMPDLV